MDLPDSLEDTTKSTGYPTEKQATFINRLLKQKEVDADLEGKAERILSNYRRGNPMTNDSVSLVISELLDCEDLPRQQRHHGDGMMNEYMDGGSFGDEIY